MDTPGGLVDSMRTMVGAILSSRVPVIVYVSPAGARAGSAGFFLMEAADVAAMAPGTNAGAAHVVFEFGKPDDTMSQKIENDAEALLRSYVRKRGRNLDAALAAVATSHSYTAEEALDQHLIDVIANSDSAAAGAVGWARDYPAWTGASRCCIWQCADRIAGAADPARESAGMAGESECRAVAAGGRRAADLSRIQHAGHDCSGGAGNADGAAGDVWLNLLPIRYTAVLLLVAALVLMVLEAKFGGHGALAIAGIVCLAFGTLTLVAAPVPEMAINPWSCVWR